MDESDMKMWDAHRSENLMFSYHGNMAWISVIHPMALQKILEEKDPETFEYDDTVLRFFPVAVHKTWEDERSELKRLAFRGAWNGIFRLMGVRK
jgi:hypothetical protein